MSSPWLGLWKSEKSGWYCSNFITKKSLLKHKEKVRIILRHNKNYEKGGNRPFYIAAFANGDDAAKVTEIAWNPVRDYWWQEILTELHQTVGNIRKAAIYAQEAMGNFDDAYYRACDAEEFADHALALISKLETESGEEADSDDLD